MAAVGGILLLAAVLRLVGVTHGVDSDEGKLVNPAATLRIRGVPRPLAPSSARYPHLGYYLHATVFWVAGKVAPTLAVNHTHVARVVTAVISLLTVVLIMRVGKMVGGWSLALLAGLLLAVMPLGVKYAHYAHVDVLAAFFMLAAVGAALRLWDSGALRWYVLTGALTGFALASQYYGLAIGIVLLFAHLGWALRQPRRWSALRRPALLLGLTAIPVAFFLASPWQVLAWHDALQTYNSLSLRAQGGDLGYTSPHLLWPLLTRSPDWGVPFTVSGLVWETTVPLFVLAILGVDAAIRRRDWRMVVFTGGILLVLYITIAGYVRMHAVKRFLPLLPLLSLAAAYGVVHAGALLPRGRRALLRCLGLLLVTWGVGSSLWQNAGFDVAYAREATLSHAVMWAHTNLPRGSTVVQHGPLVFFSPADSTYRVIPLREEYANFGRSDRRVAEHRARPLKEFLAEGADYVVLDSRLVDRYYEPTAVRMYPEMTASYREFYDAIRGRGIRVYEIRPEPFRRAGPRIEIYDVRGLRPPGTPL